jgi:hypothetical protein
MLKTNDWYWACAADGEPAADRFIVENGQERLWPRVRMEIDRGEHCAWNHVHRRDKGAHIEDILDMMLTVVQSYRINHNKFVFEAAKIPVFARFLHKGRADLCNYVSNSCFHTHKLGLEPYTDGDMQRLGRIVANTISLPQDWFL